MRQLILPVVKPYVTSYPGVANFLGILQSQLGAEEWFFENFIQVVYYENTDNEYLHEMTGSLLDLESGLWLVSQYTYCPFFEQYIISRKIIDAATKDIVDFYKNLLDDGFYSAFFINHRYFTNSQFFGHEDHDNPILLYGYDDNTQEFLVTGYFKHNLFGFHRVAYNDFALADQNVRQSNDYSDAYIQRIVLLRLRDNIFHTFSKREFLLNIEDYLEAKDHTQKLYFIRDKRYYYGLAFYDKMVEQFSSFSIDERLIQSLFDQKAMMLERLKFLVIKGYLSEEDEKVLTEQTQSAMHELEIMRNMILKNRMRYGETDWPQNLKEELIGLISQAKENDRKLMKDLYDTI